MQGREKENEKEGTIVNSMQTEMIVPSELKSPFFFPDEKVIWKEEYCKQLNPEFPFIYEAAYFSGIDAIRPWNNPEQYVPVIFDEWKAVKQNLKKLFEERDSKGAVQPMKKGIGLFLEAVYWCNHIPVRLKEQNFDQLKVKPINVHERLQFIMNRPGHYHSFVQLSELMVEQEKHFVKMMAIKK
jgi:hypothetical protein